MQNPVLEIDLEMVQHEVIFYVLPPIPAADDGAPVDLSEAAVVLTAYPPDDTSTQSWELTSDDSEITVSGTDNNQITLDDDDTNTGTAGTWRYVLRNQTADTVLACGSILIRESSDVSS